ncbi:MULTISPECIES: ribosome silencing factor [unclassified Oleiphilus]|jgi:ribosome-associated protein|uniref:ribosome silencing factor n=3 Tax=Oleiphilus TaxID=141450 RepID=UPI0007C2E11E|nr:MULTISPECIES: ribosome silencing factor [unclassified Oleiphilus]KZY46306.1 ribosome silencing factor RsfS [Oleiphilus sp. HI0050]KZY72418.1 ribosome silencing factor RsfS [Oleiphilus sp. HI0068]KZY84267.1 ribosome silencing factor RsfS [Oleiphilus sp. HI0069]KZY87205.1 ribosome silencing factor RsfS [Oleiphilus sp. HI0072]KZZ10112.1 ribosome silencing factor RsfS [Oleiphilus sp. HI0078]KZZ32079.1 ribosome silencing factor RsfS [Oleiphilus sp. HI0085]
MQTEELKTVVVEALEDLKADNICVLDVKDKTSVTDYMVIASGTSSRHVKSLAENLVSEVKDKGGRPLGIEGADGSDWVLVDLGEVVVHVMLPASRTFYDLEGFWRDGPDASASMTEH